MQSLDILCNGESHYIFLTHIDNDQLLLQWKSLPVFVVSKATAKAGKT